MLDELLAFSEQVNFDLILLRKQKNFYLEGLDKLRNKGINIYTKPFTNKLSYTKLKTAFIFIIKNILNFFPGYNAAIGVKGIIWFLKMDMDLFDANSNIHTQFATQSTLIGQLVKEYYGKSPEYSFTFHAHDIYFKNKWFKGMIMNCKNAFSISEYNIKYIKENFNVSDKILLSRLGVFQNQLDENKQINDSNIFRLGLISWFMPKKGIIYLLRAVKKLKDTGIKDFKLTLAGDGPLRGEFENFIKENDLTENIDYKGSLNSKQKKEFFKNLDVFILPSVSLENDQDGIPVVLMEAISYGLPIISTDVSGIPEICIDGYNGLLIEEKNTDEIMKAIVHLLNNPDRRSDFSINSLQLSEHYDIRKNSKNKLKIINWA